MKPALLIMDPQNDFFGEDNPSLAEFQVTVHIINSAIEIFREHRWPVIFVQHTSPKKPIGSHAWAIHAHFNCQPDDAQLSKTQYNAFWDTELDALLKNHQVDFVVVSGYVAEYCVLSTLRGALERGYRGAILAQSVASLNSRYAEFTLEISPVLTTDELQTMAN
jgi:nicotinamidase-related amidase